MPLFDPKTGCLALKFVYYGPSGAGKTTSLKLLTKLIGSRAGLLSLDTQSSRTLFFDLLTVAVPLRECRLLLRLYTVPGEPMHRHTRKLLLRGADGVVLVGGSDEAGEARPDQPPAAERRESAEVLAELRANLRESGIGADEMPLVSQARPFGPTGEAVVSEALFTLLESVWQNVEKASSSLSREAVGLTAALAELRRMLRPSPAPSTPLAPLTIEPPPTAPLPLRPPATSPPATPSLVRRLVAPLRAKPARGSS